MSNAIVKAIEGFLEPIRINGQNKKIVNQFIEQVTTIQGVGDVTKVVIDELSGTKGYADYKLTTTLEASRKIAEAVTDGTPAPEVKKAQKRLNELYVDTTIDVVDLTNALLIQAAFGNRKK